MGCNFIKDTTTQLFSCKYCGTFKNSFLLLNTSSGCSLILKKMIIKYVEIKTI